MNYDNGSATITWKVENEPLSCMYVIEKSTDGDTFVPFGKVFRPENETKTNYSFVNSRPSAGMEYYRLLVVYKNGAYGYTAAQAINEGTMEMVSAPSTH